jgi:ADP-heptose:LPS heptosyltransferase
MDKLRSLPLGQFVPIAEKMSHRVSLVSLQHGAEAGQQIAGCGFLVHDLGDDFQDGDFLDTAAIISQLDLVIAPDTAVAHLAGALGRPVWVLNATPPDWRWAGTGDTSPWYRSARVFRQTTRRGWSTVFESVALALASVVR